MRGLLLRLSALDADAENAVRVIGFFDRLVEQRVDVPALLRNAARLAECPVGVHAPGAAVHLRTGARGEVLRPEEAPDGGTVRALAPDGSVWLERAGTALPLDEILLERLAIAVTVLLDHARPPSLGDPALVELVVSETAGDADRARALHLLGLSPDRRLHLLAVAADPVGVRAVAAAVGGPAPARYARLGTALYAMLAPDADAVAEQGASTPNAVPERGASASGTVAKSGASAPGAVAKRGASASGAVAEPAVPPGVRVGVGPRLPAILAPRSWQAARTALRFADAAVVESGGPHPTVFTPVVRWDDLGGLTVLAERLDPAAIDQVDDVAALDRLAAGPGGAEALGLLHAFCLTGSARRTAVLAHRHHSSVTARLGRAETVLGFGLGTPAGRFRLALALMLRRVRDTGDPFPAP